MSFPGADELVNKGWPITVERLKEVFGDKQFSDSSELLQTLLDTDIREYSVPLLADRLNNRLCELKGPVVLQISKLRNVQCSRLTDPSRLNDGLNKIQLTDGHLNINALQFDPIPTLNTNTPAGTKICLLGVLPLESGLVLINAANCRVLGGIVERLVEKWKLEKNWMYKSVRNVDSSAPKWVPFSKRRLNNDIHGYANNYEMKNFRANDVINNIKSKKEDIESEHFGAARKAQIEQAISEVSTTKEFASSQLKMKAPPNESSPNVVKNPKKEVALGMRQSGEPRKGRRFNRDETDNEAIIHQPPSHPPTLFDFVQSKVPNCESISRPITLINNPSTGGTFRSQDGSFTSGDSRRFGRNFSRRGNGKSVDGRGDLRGGQIGRRGAKRGNSNRDRLRDSRATVNKDRQEGRFVVNNRTFPQLNSQTSALGSITNGLSAVNISASTSSADDRPMNRCDNEVNGIHFGSRRQDYSDDYGADTRIQGAHTPMGGNSGNYERDETRCSINDGAMQFFHRYGNARSNTITRRPWKVGDKCLAPWNDGQLYISTLLSLGPADMCSVQYDEYGNRSSVPIGALVVPPSRKF
uniref:Tudor domain-containing protein n=1 Tax=Parascaris univalens TaxID=6257 RepID=A0A915C939_PARUN